MLKRAVMIGNAGTGRVGHSCDGTFWVMPRQVVLGNAWTGSVYVTGNLKFH